VRVRETRTESNPYLGESERQRDPETGMSLQLTLLARNRGWIYTMCSKQWKQIQHEPTKRAALEEIQHEPWWQAVQNCKHVVLRMGTSITTVHHSPLDLCKQALNSTNE
jgi:hypothetical protein